jgi:nuclear-control-of-ATPase protein 2
MYFFNRVVERLLVQSVYSSNSNITNLATNGHVICHVHRLRTYAMYLPSRNNLRERVLDDLKVLDYPRIGLSGKIKTCERMWRCWGFLNLSHDVSYS